MAVAGSPRTLSPIVATVQDWYRSLPLCTKALFSLLTGIFVLQLATGYDTNRICLSTDLVVRHHQVYRLITAPFFHLGPWHLLFNMMTFVHIGSSLERNVGSVQFLHISLLLVVAEGLLYLALELAA
ncbi:hypothetical protein Agub_g45, partial [Astrephomene gubernaculifera]